MTKSSVMMMGSHLNLTGSDIAETADIVLVNSNPKDVANLILFGKATYRKMIQNLIWATGYNVVTLPLAAGYCIMRESC